MERISRDKLGDGAQSASSWKRLKRERSAHQSRTNNREGSSEEVEDPAEDDENATDEQTNEPQGREKRDETCCKGNMAHKVGAGRSENGPVSWIVSDPELLDCPICFEPLTVPVFQCEDGHIVCSLCCGQLSVCAICTLPVGNIRCRAMEKVLLSVNVRCPNRKYGCNEIMNYSLKNDHGQTCQHVPCSCPLSECNFISTSTKLYQHFSEKHKNAAVPFTFNKVLNITLNVKNKFIVLREEKNGDLFILNNMIEPRGNMMWVTYIAPAMNDCVTYNLLARSGGITHRFQSLMKAIQKRDDDIPALEEKFVVPADMFGYYGQLKLELRISKPYCRAYSRN